MIDFKPFSIEDRMRYDRYLFSCGERGCEYSFVNLYLWGRQQAAEGNDKLLFFSQFNRRSVYLFPIGAGDPKAAIDTIIEDAATRGIPCRLTGLLQEDCALLEQMYPGRFRYHFDRDSFDYVYDINDLADLKGRKFQKKRNHLNRFRQNNPETHLEPVTEENVSLVREFVKKWYETRLAENPHADYLMEQAAIEKALRHWRELSMEGLLLRDGQTTLAFAMGSLLSSDFSLFSSIIILTVSPLSAIIGYLSGAIEGYITFEADIFLFALLIYAIARLIDAQKSKAEKTIEPSITENEQTQESLDDDSN